MSPRTALTLTSAVLASLSTASAEPQILSCADVDCPIVNGTTAATCTVVDHTFNAVGITSLNTTTEVLQGLSWVKGVSAQNISSNQRTYEQSFYLGSPSNFSLSDHSGVCALFFTEVSDNVRFGTADPRGTDEGTCGQALSSDCVSAILERASKVNYNSSASTAEICEKLQRDFLENLDTSCSASATQKSGWTGVSAKALTGNGSSQPITQQQNSTSDCWPILPKTDDLRLVQTTNNTGDLNATTVVDKFFGITPILTVFFNAINDSNSSTELTPPQAWLTCVKAVDLTTASNATQSPGDGDVGENAAAGLRVGSVSAGWWAGVMSVVLAAVVY